VCGRSVAINSMPFLDDDDGDDGFVREVGYNSCGPIDENRGDDRVVKVASEETIELSANMKSNIVSKSADALYSEYSNFWV